MKTLFTLATALMLGLSPQNAAARDIMAGDLHIMQPTAFATPKMAKTGAGFLTIMNHGESDDTLLEVRADFPKVEVHTTEEKDGIARMMHLETLPIPAGTTVELAPGGHHVMFMGLDAPLEDGQTIPATLVFEKAGEVEVIFTVTPRPKHATGHGSDHGADHGKTMDHSNH